MGSGTKENTIGIHQQDVTVGAKAAKDLCWILVEDSVECRGVGRRLVKLDQFILVDVKTGPIDGNICGLLTNNRCRGIWSRDVCRPCDDLLSGGTCQDR